MNDSLLPKVETNRIPDHNVSPLFLNRWSPRAFLEKEVEKTLLYSILEASRWAPSSSNEQPWRFIVAQSQEDREKFYPFIVSANREWCENAPVMIVLISKKITIKGLPNGLHAFDTGTAWGFLALQASLKGLITHAMGGFDAIKARAILNVPEEYDLHAVVALGYQGSKEILSEKLQERELPSSRRPLVESIIEGGF